MRRTGMAPEPTRADAGLLIRRPPTPIARGLPAIGKGARPNVGEGRLLLDDGLTIRPLRGASKGLAVAGSP